MVEANSVIPLYKQIVRALSDSIANGTYRPGDKLPTEAELIEQFGVSRITVRSAIKGHVCFVGHADVCRGRP